MYQAGLPGGLTLPLSWTVERYRAYEPVQTEVDRTAAQTLLEERLLAQVPIWLLQNRGDALGYERYLPEENVSSHIIYDRKSEREQDDKRLEPRLHKNAHDNERENDRNGNIKRRLRLGDLARIVNNDRKPAQKLVFAQKRLYLSYRLELAVVRACVVIPHEHHRLAAVGAVEYILEHIRQNIGRDADIGNSIDPDDRRHAIDGEYFVFQRQSLLWLHIFGYDY